MIIKFKNKLIEVHGIELQESNFILYTFNKDYNYEKLCIIEMPYTYDYIYKKLFNNYNGNVLDLSEGKLILIKR